MFWSVGPSWTLALVLLLPIHSAQRQTWQGGESLFNQRKSSSHLVPRLEAVDGRLWAEGLRWRRRLCACHHVSCYLSSCRWPRAVCVRFTSWTAGSWSCWFRYMTLSAHLLNIMLCTLKDYSDVPKLLSIIVKKSQSYFPWLLFTFTARNW